MKALFIIVNAGYSEDAIKLTRKHGATGATILNARGTGKDFITLFGITVEEEKEIIISLVEDEVAIQIEEAFLTLDYQTERANGVAFALPIDKMTLINKIIHEETKKDN